MGPYRQETAIQARGPRGNLQHLTMTSSAPARVIYKLLIISSLAVLSTEVSILCLSPVYGSIPSSRASPWDIPFPGVGAALLASLSMSYLSKTNIAMLTKSLPMFGFCIPVIQLYLFKFSSIGPKWGPVFTALLTTSPLLYLSILSVLGIGQEVWLTAGGIDTRLPIFGGLRNWQFCLTLLSYGFMNEIQKVLSTRIPQLIAAWSGTSALFSRFGLQAAIAVLYTTLERSVKRLAFVGVIPLLHLIFFNPHLPLTYNTAVLNATLQAEGYSLVARQESLTGYISVLDSIKDGFRAMRCDHSLLGGEWLNKPRGPPSVLNEPIYAVFVMLEAVRLVETESSPVAVGNEKHALIM